MGDVLGKRNKKKKREQGESKRLPEENPNDAPKTGEASAPSKSEAFPNKASKESGGERTGGELDSDLEISVELENEQSWLRYVAPWLIAFAAFLCFIGSMNAPFLFDDAPVVTHNKLIHKWGFSDFSSYALSAPSRSLTNLTFYLNFHSAGTKTYPPFGSTWSYHLVSLLFHALNSALVFLLIRGLLQGSYYRGSEGNERWSPESRSPTLIAFLSALLFAVHPAQSMAVAYIAQRYALVAAACLLGTLVSYLKYRRIQDEQGQGGYFYLGLAIVLSWLCFIAKENAAVVGFLVIAVEIFFLDRRKLGQACFFAVPFFYGFAVRGVLASAFIVSDSGAFGYTMATAITAGICFLATLGWRYLPPDFPGRVKVETKSGEELEDFSFRSTVVLLIGAALFMVVSCLLLYKTTGVYRACLNTGFILTGVLMACRFVFYKAPGLLPGRSLLAFAASWFLILWAHNAGTDEKSTLDIMFPGSAIFVPEHAHKQYFLTQLRALLYYPRLMLLPWGYTAEHAYQVTPFVREEAQYGQVVMRAQEFLALLGHLAIFYMAKVFYSRVRMLSFAIIWFYISLLISSSIIPILDPLVEQRMYLPLALTMAALVVTIARTLEWILGAGESTEGTFDASRFGASLKERFKPKSIPEWILALGLPGVIALNYLFREHFDEKGAQLVLLYAGVFIPTIVSAIATMISAEASSEESDESRAAPNKKLILIPLFIAVAPVVLLFIARTQARVAVWSDREAIWMDAIEKRPDCARAYSSLGMVRLNIANEMKQDGNKEMADRYFLKAIEAVGAAIRFGEFHIEGWNNLGKAYLELDNDLPIKNRAHARVLAKKPGTKVYDPLNEAARCFQIGIERNQIAVERYGLRSGPATPLCHNNLGLVYRRQAMRYIEPINLRPNPKKAAIYLDKAIAEVEKSLKLDANYIAGLANVAALKIQRAAFEPDPVARYKLGVSCQNLLGRAIASGRHSGSVYRTIADAYVLTGNKKQAIQLLKGFASRGSAEAYDKEEYAVQCYDYGMTAYRRLSSLKKHFEETQFIDDPDGRADEIGTTILLIEEALKNGVKEKAEIYRALGKLNVLDRKPKKALEHYKKSLTLDSKSTDALEIKQAIAGLERQLKDK
ncbi:MAG: hypothetical protein P1V97_16830 [Planctomycetota bacterium]|nr:hypothetical protein [Planctomycetota bacterium]